jgi:hypothetical protein
MGHPIDETCYGRVPAASGADDFDWEDGLTVRICAIGPIKTPIAALENHVSGTQVKTGARWVA